MRVSRRWLIMLGAALLLSGAATLALWLNDSATARRARASAQRIVLETEGRQLWQASVLWASEHGEGFDDLQTLVRGQYIDAAHAARFRRGSGDARFISQLAMPAIPAGSPWGGPGEVTSTDVPAAFLAVHHDGTLHWVRADGDPVDAPP